LAVSRGLGDYEFKNKKMILASSSYDVTNYHCNMWNEHFVTCTLGSQKVSSIPDVIVVPRVQQQQAETLEGYNSKGSDDDHHDNCFIFLACDGVWDVYSNEDCVEEMIKIMVEEKEKDVGLVCEEILDLSLARGSLDNLSALLVRFSSSAEDNCSHEGDDDYDDSSGGSDNGGGGVMRRRKERFEKFQQSKK